MTLEKIKPFPEAMMHDYNAIFKGHTIYKASLKSSNLLVSGDDFTVLVDDEEIIIPYRIYSNEVGFIKNMNLNKIQKDMMHCIYTRHHDGHIRQKSFNHALLINQIWSVPYVMQLVGEYVIEILEVLYASRNKIDLEIYRKFISDNPIYYETTKSRIVSYWDCYFRNEYPRIEDYVGYKIIGCFEGVNKWQ